MAKLSRRSFLWQAGVSFSMAAVPHAAARSDVKAPGLVERVVAALGRALIPDGDGEPSYSTLEAHGITETLLPQLRGLTESHLQTFNEAPRRYFSGRSFVELDAVEAAQFLELVVTKGLPAELQAECEMVFALVRRRVFNLFYQNYPQLVERDANDLPVLAHGDQHQIISPNTDAIRTGWDHSRFPGPWTWEAEEARRSEMKVLAAKSAPGFHRWDDN